MKYFGKNILNHTLNVKKGNISGSATSTGSFGRVETSGDIAASGNISGSSTSTGSFGILELDKYNGGIGHNTNTNFGIGAGSTGGGDANLAIGYNAGNFSNAGSSINIAIGWEAQGDWTDADGDRNIAIGYQAQYDHNGGDDNIAIGYQAMKNGEGSHNDNIAIGTDAMQAIGAGASRNIGMGDKVMYNLVGGTDNIGIGKDVLFSNQAGDYNVALGTEALYGINAESADKNVAVGYRAGIFITDGSTVFSDGDSNVFIGSETKPAADDESNQIIIGANAIGKGSNTALIGDDNITDIYMSEDLGAMVHVGNISGSATSTGSFGRVETSGDIAASGNISGLSTSTGSFGSLVISDKIQGDLLVDGDITAENFIVKSTVTQMTQSFSSGSTIFGDTLDDTHQFTGSVDITGSATITSRSPLLHLNEPLGLGGDSAVRVTEDGAWRGGFIKYDGTNNLLKIGTHANNNETTGDDITAIEITRNDGYPTFKTAYAYLNQYLAHEGDDDTYLRYQTNQIDLSAGGNVFEINTTSLSGSSTSTGSFGHLKLGNVDTDASFEFGRAHVGYIGYSDMAGFSHVDNDGTTTFALAQSAAGKTIVNAKSGQPIAFKINNADVAQISSDGNFGVGIETAQHKLHVVGDGFFTGDVSGSATSTGSFGHLMQDGKGLLPQFTTGSSIFIGENAGVSDDGSNNRNIGIGKNALDAATTGQLNIAIGDDALTDVTTGNYNVAIGFESQKDTTGGQNVSVGYNSLEFNTSGNNNTAIGYAAAGGFTYSGISNIAIGYSALGGASVSGDYNIAIGHSVMGSITTGGDNLAIGDFALTSISTRSNNVAIGSEALRYVADGGLGYNNTALGWNAGKRYGDNAGNLVSASYSVFIGHTTYPLENDSQNEILIGSQVRGKGSNTATIGDGNITDIYLSQDQGATVHTGNVSGSSTSTASFGRFEGGTFSGSFHGQIGARYVHDQTTASTTWTINHNLGVQYPNVTVFDSNDVMVIPTTVTANGGTLMTLTFSSPVAGVAMVGIGGGTSVAGRTFIFSQTSTSVNWAVTHSLGEQYPAVTVYDDNDNVIIPSQIKATGINHADLTFDEAITGNAHFSVGNGLPGINSDNAGNFMRVSAGGTHIEYTTSTADVTGSFAISGSITLTGEGSVSSSATSTGSFGHGFFDSRLGIGTLSPGDSARQFEISSTGTAAGIRLTKTGGSNNPTYDIYVHESSDSLIIGRAAVADDVIFKDGNVGIGTSSPSKPLTVAGEISSSLSGNNNSTFRSTSGGARLILDSTTNETTTGIRFAEAGAIEGSIIYNHSTDQLDLRTGGADATRMTINSSGNVGIGTTTPDFKLDVEGDIRATGNIHAQNYIVSSSVTSMSFAQSSGSTIFGDSSDDIHQFTGSVKVKDGDLTVSGDQSSIHLRSADYEIITLSNIGSGGAPLDQAYFDLLSAGTTKIRFRSDGSANYINAGNLGIGTTNPVEALTVGVAAVNNTISDVLRITTTGTYDSGGSSGNGGAISFGQFHNTYPDWTVAQIAGTRNGASWNGALHFFTNDGSGQTALTEKLIITSDNKISGSAISTGSFGHGYIDSQLGIGTVSPTAPIHIQHSALSGFDSHADDLLVIERTGGVTSINMAVDTDQTSYLMFSDTTRHMGSIAYFHSGDTMQFRAGATTVADLTSTTFQPASDDAISLGTASKRWSDVHAVQTTTGGVFETGLRTKKIGDNQTGTIVSWTKDGLVPCNKNEDELVMGVIKQGKDEPIVLGAEPVLITGKIDMGDYIVTSNKVGHGKAIKKGYLLKKDLFGKVIAQALESGSGDSYTIKAMIRKM